MYDRHLGGWVSAKTCRDLVARAGDIPVVGLINEDCALGLQDGIEAGLRGVYYKDQMDAHPVRRLSRFSRGPTSTDSLRRDLPYRKCRPECRAHDPDDAVSRHLCALPRGAEDRRMRSSGIP